MTESTDELLVSESGALGHLRLNRPKALNSLTLGMVRTMAQALERWRDDDRIKAVLIDGAGERGLCAGGDIRAIYDAATSGDESMPVTFWAEEYRLNAALSHYPKPVVGIMDGICMGGGVGITAHGSHRVVTERSQVGMPEVGIGFVPDVGGTYLLSRAPGQAGTYLALTGQPVGPGDAIYCGMADHYVPSDRLAALIDDLASGDADGALDQYAEPRSAAPTPTFGVTLGPVETATKVQPSSLTGTEHAWIDEVFAADTVEEILRRLQARPEDGAKHALKAIEGKSPTSLKVTLRALRSAARLTSLEHALDEEFRVSLACVRIGDFVEGVRAALVDKDRNPRWSPSTVAEVDDEFVAKFFEPLGTGELGLSG